MKSANKILTIAVVVLLLLNVVLVVFLVRARNHHEGKRSERGSAFEMLAKEVNLTDQQKKDFEELKEAHFKMIRPLFDSIKAAKAAYFGLIKESQVSDSLMDVYGKRITDLQADADKMTFAHFQRVRKLFHGDQQKKFDEFVQKMVTRSKKDSIGREK